MTVAVALPAGYRLEAHDSLDSTNAEGLRQAQGGAADRLWVWARTQSAGRGRAGRSWVSPAGNLHASLMLRLSCPLETALQLAFVSGLAAHDAVAGMVPGELARRLALKWPNDLLLGADKLGGVLLESATSAGQTGSCVVVIGTGINLAHHPDETLRPATDLSEHGLAVTPGAALERLVKASDAWLTVWRQGEGFAAVREAWEARAIAIGQRIRVRLETGDEEGVYGGIDESGALRLLSGAGTERRITAGDVFVA